MDLINEYKVRNTTLSVKAEVKKRKIICYTYVMLVKTILTIFIWLQLYRNVKVSVDECQLKFPVCGNTFISLQNQLVH